MACEALKTTVVVAFPSTPGTISTSQPGGSARRDGSAGNSTVPGAESAYAPARGTSYRTCGDGPSALHIAPARTSRDPGQDSADCARAAWKCLGSGAPLPSTTMRRAMVPRASPAER